MHSGRRSSRAALPRAVFLGLLWCQALCAQGTTVISDPDGIVGFELYGKGLYWWQRSICGPEQVQAGKIGLRGDVSANSNSAVAEDCEVLPGITRTWRAMTNTSTSSRTDSSAARP